LGEVRYPFHKDKDLYLPMIEEFFPEVKLSEKLSELEFQDKQNKIISQKFNGDIVMSWLPDLQGKELGKAITLFKDALGNEYNDFILNSTYKEIHDYFMNVYENNK
jgi:ArsR family metal-binding transcriptional regulator